MKKLNKNTAFGNMLNNYRFHRQQALEKAERDLWKRNKLENPTTRQQYKIVQLDTQNGDGQSTHSMQLWKLVDTETVRISSSIDVEVLTDKKEEDDWS